MLAVGRSSENNNRLVYTVLLKMQHCGGMDRESSGVEVEKWTKLGSVRSHHNSPILGMARCVVRIDFEHATW